MQHKTSQIFCTLYMTYFTCIIFLRSIKGCLGNHDLQSLVGYKIQQQGTRHFPIQQNHNIKVSIIDAHSKVMNGGQQSTAILMTGYIYIHTHHT